MNRTVPLRLLMMLTLLAVLIGVGLTAWYFKPPAYNPRVESLLYQTKVAQLMVTGPLRTKVKSPDGTLVERVMVPGEQTTAPGQGAVMSQGGGTAASTAKAVAAKPTGVPAPPPLPTRAPYAVDDTVYRETKAAVPGWLKDSGVPVDLKLTMGEKAKPRGELSLTLSATTETVPGAVGLKLTLDVRRLVLGSSLAREGERLTIRTYHAGPIWVTPESLPAQIKATSEQLVRAFGDEWKTIQTGTDSETEKKE